MTPEELVVLSTRLLADLRSWVAEVGKNDAFSMDDLEVLKDAARIVERVTLREATEPPTGGPSML